MTCRRARSSSTPAEINTMSTPTSRARAAALTPWPDPRRKSAEARASLWHRSSEGFGPRRGGLQALRIRASEPRLKPLGVVQDQLHCAGGIAPAERAELLQIRAELAQHLG